MCIRDRYLCACMSAIAGILYNVQLNVNEENVWTSKKKKKREDVIKG